MKSQHCNCVHVFCFPQYLHLCLGPWDGSVAVPHSDGSFSLDAFFSSPYFDSSLKLISLEVLLTGSASLLPTMSPHYFLLNPISPQLPSILQEVPVAVKPKPYLTSPAVQPGVDLQEAYASNQLFLLDCRVQNFKWSSIFRRKRNLSEWHSSVNSSN